MLVECIPAPVFFSRHDSWKDWGMLLSGLLFTAMLAGYVGLNLSQQARIWRLVDERTRQFRDSEEKFRAIADYTYDVELWHDPDGKILWVNPAIERLLGYSPAECMAMPNAPLGLFSEDERPRIEPLFHDAIKKRTSGNDLSARLRCKDGTLRWASLSWQPIYEAQGTYLGIRSSLRDVSERKQAEEALRQAHDTLEQRVAERTAQLTAANEALQQRAVELEEARWAAEAANQAKSRFLTNMSHEIRTPMTAILGYGDLLMDPTLDASSRNNYLQVVRRNGEHLLHLINDILDLSRIEAGKLSLGVERSSLVAILSDVASTMLPRASSAASTFRSSTPAPCQKAS